jgi:hypothetical protein
MFKTPYSLRTVGHSLAAGKDRMIGLATVCGAAALLLSLVGLKGQITVNAQSYGTVEACFITCVAPSFGVGKDPISPTPTMTPSRPTQTPFPTLPPSGTPRPTATTVKLPTDTPTPIRTLHPIFLTATAASPYRTTPTVESLDNKAAIGLTAVVTVIPTFTVISPSGLLAYSCPQGEPFNYRRCAVNNSLNVRNGEQLPIRTDVDVYCNYDTVTGWYRVLVGNPPRWVAWKNATTQLGTISSENIHQGLCPNSP